MATNTKLLIIPSSGQETYQLATEIYQILRNDHGLGNQVEFLESKVRTQIPPEMLKDHRHELVADYFPDAEAQVDIGRNQLKDIIRGKHVALVEHMLTPNRYINGNHSQIISVNDHLMEIRGFLDVIRKVDTLRKTLIAPYLPYVRSHSIEKYQERGFFQFDSLRMMLKDFLSDGLDSLLVIDPHSEKASQIANDLQLDFHGINPFQSGRSINPYKLGFSEEKASEMMSKLKPFQERFKKLKTENSQHLYGVSLDDGTEKRTENFIERAFPELNIENAYSKIAYLGKDRISYEEKTSLFKTFSRINEQNIDPEGTYILIDDMIFTGGSAQKVAEKLKQAGAKRVELWVSHAVTTPTYYQKVNEGKFIDQIVSLDTIPQNEILNIEYIPASARLLAAELYKDFQKLASSR